MKNKTNPTITYIVAVLLCEMVALEIEVYCHVTSSLTVSLVYRARDPPPPPLPSPACNINKEQSLAR